MIVAGVMSGTSADGIDVALVNIAYAAHPGRTRRPRTADPESLPRLEFLGHADFPYPPDVRRMVLASMNSPNAKVADLARLNFLLGDLYAEAVRGAEKRLGTKAELVGCHGQTLYHQGTPAKFLGRSLAVTWQIGEASRMTARLSVPVISDFRPADMAAGGKGAPLVPYLDYLLYGDADIGRIALNIGGIANLTAIPPSASPEQFVAFDTGPGNMVIDALMEQLFAKPYDRNGRMAASGQVLESVVTRFLRQRFFRLPPPKTAGREQFGRNFVQEFLRACRGSSKIADSRTGSPRFRKSDLIATAAALTTRSIVEAVRRYVLVKGRFSEVIVSGGGARNATLMAGLTNEFKDCGLSIRASDEFGVPSQAKEAVAFAVLAFETWNRRPSNLPAATGAKHAVVLGKISYP